MSRKAYTKEERESLRERMIEHSAKVFSEKGLRETSLEDIYLFEGISKTFFYSFFPSKTALIIEVFRTQSVDILDTVRRNVWEYGSINGLRETMAALLAGRWYVATFDDQVYLRGILSEDDYMGFKNDRIVLFAEILNILGVPVSRLDPRVFYNMIMTIVWTSRSGQASIPFLYGEVIRESTEIQIEHLVDHVSSLRVDSSQGFRRDG